MPYKDPKKRKEYHQNYRKTHKINYTKNNKCKCGKLICNGVKECQECYFKNRRNYKGKNNPNFGNGDKIKGNHNPMFGKHHTEETKEKIRRKLKGRKCSKKHIKNISKGHIGIFSGNKHPNWQNGISKLPYAFGFNKILKEQIRKRDNYTCQGKDCGIKQQDYYRKLDIHHVDYDKSNCKKDNLISLCQSCHSKTNFNRDYWYSYFTYIMEN